VSSRVSSALASPPRSHLDVDLLALMDDVRDRLARTFRAPAESLTLAVSGSGSAAMETVVANLVEPGRRALVIVTGYFGERLASTIARYGADVTRLDVEWGRAVDPPVVRRTLETGGRWDLVAVVHGETSTGVRNPVAEIAQIAREFDALTVVDAVTSLGTVPLAVADWGLDAVFACAQKGLGAPPGLSPIVFAPRALDRRVRSHSFYFDLDLLASYWTRRAYHHTISSPLVYALWTALAEVDDEGLAARWQRHERVHRALVEALDRIGLRLLPAERDRLWSLNAVVIPEGVDDAATRRRLADEDGIEIGGGLGPLAGRIWRIGLMGGGAEARHVDAVVAALARVLNRSDRGGEPHFADVTPQASTGGVP
jgi:alanine-glyoxylate transaminase/serine-glyoxylate transaminase/serine-pyruvate transaminase